MVMIDPQAKLSRRKKWAKAIASVKQGTEFIKAEHISSAAIVDAPIYGVDVAGPRKRRVFVHAGAEGAGKEAALYDADAAEAVEASLLLERIGSDLAIEEAFVAQLMKRHGL